MKEHPQPLTLAALHSREVGLLPWLGEPCYSTALP